MDGCVVIHLVAAATDVGLLVFYTLFLLLLVLLAGDAEMSIGVLKLTDIFSDPALYMGKQGNGCNKKSVQPAAPLHSFYRAMH